MADMYPKVAPQVQANPAQFAPTTLNELMGYAQGVVVRLPDFGEGQPFYARVRRPSMLQMASEGKIPNALLGTANALFAGNDEAMDIDNSDMLPQMLGLCVEMARATLLEPTYDEIVSSGLMLTDQQLMFIFNYTQGGVEELKSFRSE